ncbi:uncharacterized mitochondrial protein AtMg00810-like [Nicotiana sylvestris]|uniref:uncharacterized mitochondrial protein AtMg00810-like n=1 Tax=Nicotiana sylvestris TaxID=4096 RepID=UPI00388C91FE
MVTVRIVISVAASHNWPLYKMDVNNAFQLEAFFRGCLHGFASRVPKPGEYMVCKLLKSLYGLKQASRQWNIKLTDVLQATNYIQNPYDHSLFTRKEGEEIDIILIFVDDLLITRNSRRLVDQAKQILHKNFKVKDLGELRYFLGIEVLRSQEGILLNQRKYTLELISDVVLSGSKPVNAPMEVNAKLTTIDYDAHVRGIIDLVLTDITSYQKLMGKLIYLTIIRLDISFVVQVLSQFMQQPKVSHWELALRLVRYLKGSPGQGILLKNNPCTQLTVYCDSDCAACPNTTRSVTGYIVKLEDCNDPIGHFEKLHPVRQFEVTSSFILCVLTCVHGWILFLDESKSNGKKESSFGS